MWPFKKKRYIVVGGDPPYPPYVNTEEERRRWDLSKATARDLAANSDIDDPAFVWLATRSIYNSDIPTE